MEYKGIPGLVSCIGVRHVEPYSLKINSGPYLLHSPFISNDFISEHYFQRIERKVFPPQV